jgi:hypothetical protein
MLEVLPLLEMLGVQVDAVVTDPPYHLTSIVKRFGADNAAAVKPGKTGAYARASAGFMGKKWDGGDIAFRPETWRLVYDVMKPGAHLVAFGGTRTFARMSVAIEDAGFEIRDSIWDFIDSDALVSTFMESLDVGQSEAFARCIEQSGFGGLLGWVFGSGFPKSHDVSKGIDRAAGVEREVVGANPNSRPNMVRVDAAVLSPRVDAPLTAPATDAARQWSGWGTALKPAVEPIVLARKPLIGTVAANVQAYGTGALNIGACRVPADAGRPWRVADRNEASDAGRNAYGRGLAGSRAVDDTTIGRWPANVITDGSDEVLAAFPQTGAGAFPAKRGPGGIGNDGHKGQSGLLAAHTDAGSAARFFYCAKATKADRIGSKHPTVKPIALIRYLCRLVTPPGGTILDPFAGSGTLAAAAHAEGFNAILVEREAEYIADIQRRIRDVE